MLDHFLLIKQKQSFGVCKNKAVKVCLILTMYAVLKNHLNLFIYMCYIHILITKSLTLFSGDQKFYYKEILIPIYKNMSDG
jgi:hypothetical protein